MSSRRSWTRSLSPTQHQAAKKLLLFHVCVKNVETPGTWWRSAPTVRTTERIPLEGTERSKRASTVVPTSKTISGVTSERHPFFCSHLDHTSCPHSEWRGRNPVNSSGLKLSCSYCRSTLNHTYPQISSFLLWNLIFTLSQVV